MVRAGDLQKNIAHVDETRPCMWYKIYERAFSMGREELLLEVLPALDWNKVGTETWGDVVRQIQKVGTGKVFGGLTNKDPHVRTLTWDSVFRPVRHPEWWQGDSEYHDPAYDDVASELERRLKAGEFVVTSEVAPPVTVSTKKLTEDIHLVKPYAAAVNLTDSPSATPRMRGTGGETPPVYPTLHHPPVRSMLLISLCYPNS